ncbi:MAG: CvpA family protein [bacterium]
MIDLFFIISIIAFFKIGYERGIIAEIADIIALIIGIIVTFNLTEPIAKLINSFIKFPNLSFLNFIVGTVIFFSSIFIVLAIAYGLELYSKSSQALDKINRNIGGILAVSKTLLLWWAIFVIISIFPSDGPLKQFIMDSYSYQFIMYLHPYIISLFQLVFPENINIKIKKIIK